MVCFICDACGQTIKKQKVEKHYQVECRNCSVLSCIDCGKDFPGDSYASHTSCISEAEKYQGKLYKAKEKANKGERKQQEWLEQVRSASSGGSSQDPRVRKLMAKITSYSNVPRKEAKFKKFCQNSMNIKDQALLEKLWQSFSEARNTKGPNDASDDDPNTRKGNESCIETSGENVTLENGESSNLESAKHEGDNPEESGSKESIAEKKKEGMETEVEVQSNEIEKDECRDQGDEKADESIQKSKKKSKQEKKKRKKENKKEKQVNLNENNELQHQEDDQSDERTKIESKVKDGTEIEQEINGNEKDETADQEESKPDEANKKKRKESKQEKKKRKMKVEEEQVNETEKDEPIDLKDYIKLDKTVEKEGKKSKRVKKKKLKMVEEEEEVNGNEQEVENGGRKSKKKRRIDGEQREEGTDILKVNKKAKYDADETEQNKTEEKQNGSFRKRKKSKHQEVTEPSPLLDTDSQNGENETDKVAATAEAQEEFRWEAVIKKVLKSAPDNEMSIKKLRKKVINEFLTNGGDQRSRTEQELHMLFEKKLHKNHKIKVQKEKAKYCK